MASDYDDLKEELPKIKKEEEIDFVITNGENSAGGMGITEKNFKEIIKNYDLVIDTTNSTPEEIAEKIKEEYEKWLEK